MDTRALAAGGSVQCRASEVLRIADCPNGVSLLLLLLPLTSKIRMPSTARGEPSQSHTVQVRHLASSLVLLRCASNDVAKFVFLSFQLPCTPPPIGVAQCNDRNGFITLNMF
jgi:hypothetical protein